MKKTNLISAKPAHKNCETSFRGNLFYINTGDTESLVRPT